MPKQVSATITFLLHENLEEELIGISPALYNAMVEKYIKDSMEDERVGAAQYNTFKVSIQDVKEVEDA